MRAVPIEFPGGEPVEIEVSVRPGDHVKRGDFIATVRTDKATQELEAFDEMVVREVRRTPRGFVLLVDD